MKTLLATLAGSHAAGRALRSLALLSVVGALTATPIFACAQSCDAAPAPAPAPTTNRPAPKPAQPAAPASPSPSPARPAPAHLLM